MSSAANLCVLFADVSGSTRLYEKLGEAEAAYAVDRCIKRMERAAAIHRGRVVKVIGDEMMVVFGQPDAAFQSACEMQQRIDDLPPVSGVKLSVRAGFHWGSAAQEGEDVRGDAVSVAARMVGLANGGQILTTAATLGCLAPPLRQATRPVVRPEAKGQAQGPEVFEVVWREAPDFAALAASMREAARSGLLRLRHAGLEVQVDDALECVSLGRDGSNNLIIADRRASRSHARIERRATKYVLVDLSTNGTFVTFEGEREFALKHEETVLRGRGRLAFGHSSRDRDAEVVEFVIAEPTTNP
jgi:class 3 adenylate cyclase